MDDCPEIIAQLLADDRHWLIEQPGLADWSKCCRRLGDAMCAWIEQITANWTTEPLRCGDLPRGKQAAGQPAAKTAAGAGDVRGCLRRLWQVWSHHWQDAQKQAGGPVDGFEVAAAIHSGHGFRKYRQLRAGKPGEPAGDETSRVHQLATGRLRGNPFHDILLVELSSSGDADAIRYLKRQFSDIARRVAVARQRAFDPDDWHSFVNLFISDGRLARFEGKSGLSIYLATSYTRDYLDATLGRQDVRNEVRRVSHREQWIALDAILTDDRREELREHLRQLEGDQPSKDDYRWRVRRVAGQLTTEEQVAWERRLADSRDRKQRTLATDELDEVPDQDVAECQQLLTEQLTAALRELDDRQRIALFKRYREGTLGRVVAALMSVSPGQFSRIERQAVARLRECVQERVGRDDVQAECCRECWQLLTGHDAVLQLAEMLGRALEECAEAPDSLGVESSSTDLRSGKRLQDAATKLGAQAAPRKKGGA